MNKLHLYFKTPPPVDRFFWGDRYIIPMIRRLLKGSKVSGIEKVFINLIKGFNELNIAFDINLPFENIPPGEPVVVLGSGKYALQGYNQPNPVIAGIGLMTHPHEWPLLLENYPVVKYLQHSVWTRDLYIPYFGAPACELWAAGIDTEKWSPSTNSVKKFDVLIYNKIMWEKPETDAALRLPILNKLKELGLSYREIVYGNYKESEYFDLLNICKSMIFLCEHESQGFACCEALSMNIPVYAWDQGFWLDPNRFKWNEYAPVVATSVPFFDDTCGSRFINYQDFEMNFNFFWQNVNSCNYSPRDFILQNLTLKKSAEGMLDIIKSVYR